VNRNKVKKHALNDWLHLEVEQANDSADDQNAGGRAEAHRTDLELADEVAQAYVEKQYHYDIVLSILNDCFQGPICPQVCVLAFCINKDVIPACTAVSRHVTTERLAALIRA